MDYTIDEFGAILFNEISGKTFIGLTDTPLAYAGSALRVLAVNAAPDAVIFASELYWDDVNDRLGIGVAAPDQGIEIDGSIHINDTNAFLYIDRGTAARRGALVWQTNEVTDWAAGVSDSDEAGNGTEFFIGTGEGGAGAAFWIETNGNVGINATAPTAQLLVNQSSGTGAKPVLTLDQADADYVLAKIIATAAAASADRTLVADSDYNTPGALVGWIQIEIQDDGNRIADGDYYIPFYAVPT